MTSRGLVALCLHSFLSTVVLGQLTWSLDVLSPDDNGGPAPAGVVVVDLFVDVAQTDTWTAAGLGAYTFENARFRFAMHEDPNTGDAYPQLVNPGLENRHVTLLSRPLARNADRRFEDGGVALAGCFCTTCPAPGIITSRHLSIAWFASPPEGPNSPSRDGYILRIALDVSESCNPGSAAAYLAPQAPQGFVPIMLSNCLGSSVGTALATFDVPDPVFFEWGIFIDATATCPGDANRDRVVNMDDLTRLLSSFGRRDGDWSYGMWDYSRCCDFDENGVIDLLDLAVVLSAFGESCP